MLKILLVEDSTFFRKLFKETLVSLFPSMEIEEATDADEAWHMIEASIPNLIFVDIRLPGKTGLELTKQIKAKYPDITVAILTSYDLPEYREAAFKFKANYFLSKGSSTKDDILRLVKSILPGKDLDSSGIPNTNHDKLS